MRRRFFVERFTNGTAVLAGEGAHHLGRVLRAGPGQQYELSDGHAVCLARIVRIEREAVEFALEGPIDAQEPRLQATLLLAIVKFDRFEWALEKATELGAVSIVPVDAERCDKGLVVAAVKRAERWRKILLESAQQARCLRPPVLQPTARGRDAFRHRSETAGKHVAILLSERPGAVSLRQVFSGGPVTGAPNTEGPVQLSLAVGPEGGWTDAEFSAAGEAGFREASLGGNILRTETAVVAGLAAAHLYFER